MKKKNVTITLDEEILDWARIKAAKRRSSLSRMLGEILEEEHRMENNYEKEMVAYFDRPRNRIISSEPYPTREEIHERR